MIATGPYASQSGTLMPRLIRKPGAPPIRSVLNMVSQACDLHQLGIM